MRLGIDTGGTFTDIVTLASDGTMELTKVPSSRPGDSGGILAGIEQQLGGMGEVDVFIHGTTMATNALIEKNGARCALIGTDGFRDLLEIRRANRPKEGMLSIAWDPPAVLIPRRFRFTVAERINYRGDVLVPLDEDAVREVLRRCAANRIEAVAVSLLNSFKNPAHELRIGELIAEELPGAYVTLSHRLVPVVREFERTATVAANVFVGPQMERYLSQLSDGCAGLGLASELLVMQSHGGVMSSAFAARNPVRAARSGPVAGVIAAARVGAEVGVNDLVSFDMGGTSCDISVVRDGKPTITDESEIEFGLPVLFPSVLIDTIGAGGGSIAWVDGSGRLRSGPESARANPGPACYGRGGELPTTTDAHVVLGTLGARSLLGGQMELDVDAARRAVARVAEQLGEDVVATAAGIIRVSNSIMEQGVRRMTLEQGHDPRDLALVPFGGAGPLHAAAIARAMHIPEVIVPQHPGVTSALGLLFADLRHDHIESFGVPVPLVEPARVEEALARGREEVRARLEREGVGAAELRIEHFLNMKYAGGIEPQAIAIAVDVSGGIDREWLDAAVERFHAIHAERFNYAVESYPVEIESVRVEGIGVIETAQVRPARTGEAAERTTREVFFPDEGRALTATVVSRDGLVPGDVIEGPAIVEQFDATTTIEPGMTATIDERGNIRIRTGVA
ncbi:MAG: hydantoinase/oxoprolinase family protein [Thermoleophilia bacterium]